MKVDKRTLGRNLIYGEENTDMWRVVIKDDGHTQELSRVVRERQAPRLSYLNSWLFRLNPDKDSNVALFYEKEINIPRPYIFNTNNRHMFVSAKNDPTVLLDSFDINLEEKYQVESVDADEYDVYVPNNERKRPEEKFFRKEEHLDNYFTYMFEEISTEDTDRKRNHINDKIYVTMKNDPYILLDTVDGNIDREYENKYDISLYKRVVNTQGPIGLGLALNIISPW